MKVVHVHARKEVQMPSFNALEDLKTKYDKIGLVSSAQYAYLLPELKKFFGNKALSSKSLYYEGQVIGCNASAAVKVKDDVDCFVFLGEGEFHGIEVGLETNKPVFVFNFEGKLMELDPKYFELHEKKRFAMISKAMRAKSYGILLSTKPGQEFIKLAKNIQKKLPNAYVFVTDTLNYDDLLNFPDIECWINTMCPRIIDDAVKGKFGNKAFINAKDIKYLIK